MSITTKRAAFVITVFLTFAVYSVMSSVVVTGSGGLGAVSVEFSEAILKVLVLSAFVGLFFYWRHRRQSRRQNAAGRP